MRPVSPLEQPLRFFDDDVIAVLWGGHYYGVRSLHLTCFQQPTSGWVSTVLASDEHTPYLVAEHCCFACGQSLLSLDECSAVVRLREELHLANRLVPIPLFRWHQERKQYEAQIGGKLLTVTYGMMAYALYKCLHSGLDVRRAFDASEWEVGPHGQICFIVLKKKPSELVTGSAPKVQN